MAVRRGPSAVVVVVVVVVVVIRVHDAAFIAEG